MEADSIGNNNGIPNINMRMPRTQSSILPKRARRGVHKRRVCTMMMMMMTLPSEDASRCFPHQVEIGLTSGRAEDQVSVMDRFCRTLGFVVQRSGVQDGAIRYCFADPGDAEIFRRQFGERAC